jgi:membrane protease YdiL (CAAX protease family)
MRKHPLFSFFFLACALSWVLEIPYTLEAWGILPGDWSIAFALHTFGPAISAIYMVRLTEGETGLSRLREHLRDWRVGWLWLLFIFAGIPMLIMLGIMVQPRALTGFLGVTPLTVAYYPLYYFEVWFLGSPLGEEIGWRGFALPRIQPRYGPLRGTLLLGVLWAFWHLEDFLTPAQAGGPGTTLVTFFTNFPIFILFILSLAVIFTWLFNHTRGSIFDAISAHASVNTPLLALVPLFPAVTHSNFILGGVIGYGALGLLILALTRGRLGYNPDQAGSSMRALAMVHQLGRGKPVLTRAPIESSEEKERSPRPNRILRILIVATIVTMLGLVATPGLAFTVLEALEMMLVAVLLALIWLTRSHKVASRDHESVP